jgi:hypothetical protein
MERCNPDHIGHFQIWLCNLSRGQLRWKEPLCVPIPEILNWCILPLVHLVFPLCDTTWGCMSPRLDALLGIWVICSSNLGLWDGFCAQANYSMHAKEWTDLPRSPPKFVWTLDYCNIGALVDRMDLTSYPSLLISPVKLQKLGFSSWPEADILSTLNRRSLSCDMDAYTCPRTWYYLSSSRS